MAQAKLEEARESYRRRSWAEAYELFSSADREAPLAASDLELLANAAYLSGRDLEFHRALERAHHARLELSHTREAARSAFWLALMLLLRGETGPASGWLARAQRLIDGVDCVEHGYLLLPIAEQHLAASDADTAFSAAAAAAEIGERFRDADLAACARHLQGRARIQQRQVERGLVLLDEAMVAVSSGELSPIVTGLIYCSVIEACQSVFALERAREWTAALSRWCDEQPQIVAFTGTCLVYRAAVMQFGGAWTEAMEEASHACARAVAAGDRRPPGSAFYRQGEIHRLRGEFAAAEKAYREASALGCEPQPGLALLRAAQGRIDAAHATIRRVVGAAGDPLHRAKLLPAAVEIAIVAGDLEAARAAASELDEIAAAYGTDVLLAMAAHARGAVELADGRPHDALTTLRRAFEMWQQGDAPYETARVRLLLGSACREVGDRESADLELDAARAMLERLGASPELARLDSYRGDAGGAKQHRLTRREIDVLRRVAAGKTNKAIASELSVSERTVDRHVSNILSKLGVPSRAAAAAFASVRNLV